MPAQRLPWFRFWVAATSHAKVRTLDDGTFRTWVELLDAAAQQPRRGRFATRAEAAAITRRPAKHIVTLIAASLIDDTPEGLMMHDWDDWQRWRKEDTNDTGTTTDRPPNGHVIDSRTTTEQPTEPQTNIAAPLREKKKRDRDIDIDIDVDVERDNAVAAVAAPGGVAGWKPLGATLRRLRPSPEDLPDEVQRQLQQPSIAERLEKQGLEAERQQRQRQQEDSDWGETDLAVG